MNAKQAITVLVVSIALLALLGCTQPLPLCKGEGQAIPVIAEPPECCSGLTLIQPKQAGIVGISGYCTAKCGNGTCDEVIESEYNCPADCAVEQVVGPEYYSSEEEAFNVLGEELEGMPDLSAEDLESLLGE